MQTKFQVLPTDPRYLDLTREQFDLMYEHFRIDNPIDEPETTDSKYRDTDYEDAEKSAQEYSSEEAKDEGMLPLQDFESFSDPDFDAEWDTDSEFSANEFVQENDSESDSLNFEEQTENEPKGDTSLYKGEEWTEV